MKPSAYLLAPMLLALSLAGQIGCSCPSIEVHFSPGGSPTAAIVETLDSAKRSVLVQAYSFTSDPIASALIRAHGRGVAVQVVVDRSQASDRNVAVPSLKAAGIPVWVDRGHAIQHNKVMVVDRRIVITGSFNFSRAAEGRNAENLVVINDPKIAARYVANFEGHKKHSEYHL